MQAENMQCGSGRALEEELFDVETWRTLPIIRVNYYRCGGGPADTSRIATPFQTIPMPLPFLKVPDVAVPD